MALAVSELESYRHATIQIDGETAWRLRSAEVIESLCTSGSIVADVECDGDDVDPSDMLGKWFSIQIPSLVESRQTRHVGGVITQWQQLNEWHQGSDRLPIRLWAAAPIEQMRLRRQTRQFNNMSVLAICRTLFDEWGERVQMVDTGPMMVTDNEPCTIPLQHVRQVNETDLDFIRRICAQAGIFTRTTFDGPDQRNVHLLLGTFSPAADAWATDLDLQYGMLGSGLELHRIFQWERRATLEPQIPVVSTWHTSVAGNTRPSNANLMETSPSSEHFKGWEYIDNALGSAQAGLRMTELRDALSNVREQSLHLERVWRQGLTESPAIVPGCIIAPNSMPGGDDGPFFVTASRLIVLGETWETILQTEYSARGTFTAIPADTPFRPPVRLDRMEPPQLGENSIAGGVESAIQEWRSL